MLHSERIVREVREAETRLTGTQEWADAMVIGTLRGRLDAIQMEVEIAMDPDRALARIMEVLAAPHRG